MKIVIAAFFAGCHGSMRATALRVTEADASCICRGRRGVLAKIRIFHFLAGHVQEYAVADVKDRTRGQGNINTDFVAPIAARDQWLFRALPPLAEQLEQILDINDAVAVNI